MPALRERKEDIPDFVICFLKKYDYRGRIRGLTAEAFEKLKRYDWPGNIRELENAIERAVILCSQEYITPAYLPIEMADDSEVSKDFIINLPEEGISLEAVERNFIVMALERSNGNQTKAARLLGITRSALIYRMEKHGIGTR